MKNYKIVDKSRFITFICIAILFIATTLAVVKPEEHIIDHTEEYTVQYGDTLWGIGTQYRPSNMSIQEYLFNLEQYNGITPEIRPEQKIKI